MIHHVVLMKFRPTADKNDVDLFIDEMCKLPDDNKEILNYTHGRCVPNRFHSGDFDWAVSCDVQSEEAMERYMSHWGHLRMAAYLPDILDNMISFDYVVEHRWAGNDQTTIEQAIETEKRRLAPPHADPAMAFVPEIRGRRIEDARAVCERFGLSVVEVSERSIGSVWAEGRVVGVEPTVGSEVTLGTTIEVIVTGAWLCGAERPPSLDALANQQLMD